MNIVEYNYTTRIYEEVYKDVKQFINEENGIANFVYKTVDKTIKNFRNNLNKGDSFSIKQLYKGVKEVIVRVQFKIGQHLIDVDFKIIAFANKNLFLKYGDSLTIEGGGSDLGDNYIAVYSYSVDGNINYRTIYDTLQHEVSHIYETFKSNRENEKPINDKHLELYNKIQDIIQNGVNSDEYRICLGLYMWFQTEQTAFANGLDGILRNSDGFDKNNLIYNSEAWHMLENAKWCIENCNRYKQFIETKIGIMLNRYITLIEQTYHNFTRRIARVCNKYSVSGQIREGYMIKLSTKYRPFKLI